MTINVHSISHLCTKVEDLGPLFCHSCFFYEDLNKDFRNLYSGTQNVNEQICKNVGIQQGLPHLAKYMLPGSPAFNLYKKMTSHQKIKSSLVPISDQISVLPHFTNVGDTETVTEMARKLLPEAKVVRFFRFMVESSLVVSAGGTGGKVSYISKKQLCNPFQRWWIREASYCAVWFEVWSWVTGALPGSHSAAETNWATASGTYCPCRMWTAAATGPHAFHFTADYDDEFGACLIHQ